MSEYALLPVSLLSPPPPHLFLSTSKYFKSILNSKKLRGVNLVISNSEDKNFGAKEMGLNESKLIKNL